LESLELLRQLYENESEPAFGFSADYRIVWENHAAEQRFPSILEGMDIREQFPEFALDGLEYLQQQLSSVTLHARSGIGRMTILRFGKPSVYAALWSETEVCHLDPEDQASAEGVQLLEAGIRQGVFRIFNHLDVISMQMEKAGMTVGVDSAERIEKNCQQLLRLGSNLRGYYGSSRQEAGLMEPVWMEEYLGELFREIDFQLDALDIELVWKGSCKGAVCEISRNRFTSAILNLIDLSAAYAPEGGKMEFSMSKTEKEFCLTFTDSHTPAALLKGGLPCTVPGEGQGRSVMSLPKVSLGVVDRIVREHGGRCILDGGRQGMKAVIRLPLCDAEIPMVLKDEPAYTVRYRGQNRTSLVSILLSDLER
jgi:hypothetical protein